MFLLLPFFPKITYSRFKKAVNYFITPENIWESEVSDFMSAGWEENVSAEFIAWKDNQTKEKLQEILDKENVRIININDEEYPELLKKIPDPPFTLFVRGKIPPLTPRSLSVVGTRKHSVYAKIATEKIVSDLARRGFVIVSGLALGIDALAHEYALKAGGKTVAFLGSSVASREIYPVNNQKLADEIVANGGAIISEYPPGFMPTNYSFPMRNRLIAGSTPGTLVIEAPTGSGSLITAKNAKEYSRVVMCLPHPINSIFGAGGNLLLQNDAKLILKPEDILEVLNLNLAVKQTTEQTVMNFSPDEEKILNIMSTEPKNIDFIIRESGLPGPQVSAIMVFLEMRGIIKNAGNMNFYKNIV
jgi:DNA processing protein